MFTAAGKVLGAAGNGGITGELVASGANSASAPVVDFGVTIQDGDLILAGHWDYAYGGRTLATGLTQINSITTPYWYSTMFRGYMLSGYRVCTGTEGTSVTITTSGTGPVTGVAALFRFSEPVTGITYNTFQTSYALNGSPTVSYSLTGSGNDVPQIAWGRNGSYSTGSAAPSDYFSLSGYDYEVGGTTTKLVDAWRLTFDDEDVTWYSSGVDTGGSGVYHARAATIVYPTF